jgi:hypothetical protein
VEGRSRSILAGSPRTARQAEGFGAIRISELVAPKAILGGGLAIQARLAFWADELIVQLAPSEDPGIVEEGLYPERACASAFPPPV